MVKNKKYKFAIYIDEHGRERLHLKKLISLLEDEYPFLKQKGCLGRNKSILKAKAKEIIVFGSSKRNDFSVVDAETYDALTEDRRFPIVNLQGDFKKVKKYLKRYAENNYSNKFTSCYCYKYDVVDEDYFCTPTTYSVVVETPPVKKKRKAALGLDKVSVHHNFVKVGWDLFDIYVTKFKEEYVKVDGNIYWIERDSYGNGKLVV